MDLGIQGFLAPLLCPNDDSLSVWVEWTNAPDCIPAGTVIAFDVLVTATCAAGPDACDPPACPGDCADGNGEVGIEDFLRLLGQWGGTGSCDIVNPCPVDIQDFLEPLGQWGACRS